MSVIKKIAQIIRELYQDRLLLFDLTQKDLKKKFAGSVFGLFWAFAQPLMTILVYWIAFQFGFKSPDVGKIPYALWFLAAIVPWLFISESISASSNCFIEYSYLVKKVMFNIDILPMTKILSSFIVHVVFLLLIEVIYIIFGIWPTLKLVQIIYYAFCAISLTYAISLIFSSITVFFRDLSQIISIILLIGMWTTPIAWNIEYFSEPIQHVLMLNPFYYIVEGYRDSFIGRDWFVQKMGISIYFWIVTLMLLVMGTVLYNRLKPHFADIL